MSKIILDPTTSGKFRQCGEQVEPIDESGPPLGTFIPVGKRHPYQTPEIAFSTERLNRFAGEPGGRSLAEILLDLEKAS